MRRLTRVLPGVRRACLGMLILGLILLEVRGQPPEAGDGLKLWFRQPVYNVPGDVASSWDRQVVIRRGALPVGNGRLGGIVLGGVEYETIYLNEHSLWSGGPQDADNPEALKVLPEIRRLLFEGKYVEAEELTRAKAACRGVGFNGMNGPGSAMVPFGSFQTLGNLELHFDEHGGKKVEEYRRELDLNTGIARVVYRIGDTQFTREVFSSAEDQVLVVRLACDKPEESKIAALRTSQGISASPSFVRGCAGCVAAPRALVRTIHRIESSDYSGSRLLTYKCQQSKPDYSTKPPSIWASTSRCTQLYGSIA